MEEDKKLTKADLRELVESLQSRIVNLEETMKGVIDNLQVIAMKIETVKTPDKSREVLTEVALKPTIAKFANFGPINRDAKGNPLNPALAQKLASGEVVDSFVAGVGPVLINTH